MKTRELMEIREPGYRSPGRRSDRAEDESRMKIITEKKLSTYKYLRQLRRIPETLHERTVLLAHHRHNKLEFKELIKELRIHGWEQAKSNKIKKVKKVLKNEQPVTPVED